MSSEKPTFSDQNPLATLQSSLLTTHSAHLLACQQYRNRHWLVLPAELTKHAIAHRLSVRVYYLPIYIPRSQLTRLLVDIPYICTSGDQNIVTQDGKSHHSLEDAKADHGYLLTPQERRLSRNKCIVSSASVYAVGGYKTPLRPLTAKQVFDVVVVSAAGPQFEAEYLDYADFMLTPDGHGGVRQTRLKEYEGLGRWPEKWEEVERVCTSNIVGEEFWKLKGVGVFHQRGYVESMTQCVHLWLSAFNDALLKMPDIDGDEYGKGIKRNGYFKLTAIGTGFFADVGGTGMNIGNLLMQLLIIAVEASLKNHRYPLIVALEFPDFSGHGLFTPKRARYMGVDFVTAPYKDVLDFGEEVRKEYVCGVLNPGDCFACVGNELGYGSVEAMIGNNTSVRGTQCYIWNELVLDEGSKIGIDV